MTDANNTEYTMELPARFNQKVVQTLKSYKSNGQAMLVILFYAVTVQVGEHRNSSKLKDIFDATRTGADDTVITQIAGKLCDGITFKDDGTIKLAKGEKLAVNEANAHIVLDAMNRGLSFRSHEMLQALGLRAGKVTPEIDIAKAAARFAKACAEKEGVTFDDALKIACDALQAAFTADDTKPVADAIVPEVTAEV